VFFFLQAFTSYAWKKSIQPKLASENDKTISEWTNSTLLPKHANEISKAKLLPSVFFFVIRLKD
jgi:hypothetical protein